MQIFNGFHLVFVDWNWSKGQNKRFENNVTYFYELNNDFIYQMEKSGKTANIFSTNGVLVSISSFTYRCEAHPHVV